MRAPTTPAVYLLHFSRPYHHARHYLGYTTYGVEQRLADHLAGRGARLVQVVVAAGIGVVVARTWPGQGREFERRLKNRKDAAYICPFCNPRAMSHAKESTR